MPEANRHTQPAQPRHPQQEVADLLGLALHRYLTPRTPLEDGGFQADGPVAIRAERSVNPDPVLEQRNPA